MGPTPNRKLDMTRVAATAMPMPSRMPTAVMPQPLADEQRPDIANLSAERHAQADLARALATA